MLILFSCLFLCFRYAHAYMFARASVPRGSRALDLIPVATAMEELSGSKSDRLS